MKIIIDTNIFIHREDYDIVDEELQKLLKALNELNFQILRHPLSEKELAKDKDEERKKVILSKIATYTLLEDAPNPEKDDEFMAIFGGSAAIKNEHELIDINLLYSIYKNAADFLVTEDRGIHNKAKKAGLSDRVFDIHEALEYINKTFVKGKIRISSPPPLREEFIYNLNEGDPFFDDLKKDYGDGFSRWWKKICKEHRKAWVYYEKDRIGAFLSLKEEDEAMPDCTPALPKKKRLKICTLKASYTGYKIGELFVKMSIEHAIKSKINELYLTHFTIKDDRLINLISEFGFRYVAKKKNGELIFIKRLSPEEKVKSREQITKEFYPTFYDGEDVNKFLIPIRPEYHDRLFTEQHHRQLSLLEIFGQFITEGNTIKKAYLSHATIRSINKGDLLLFYRSSDMKAITSIGVVDEVFTNLTDPDEILRKVGKRTVYSREEIVEMAKKPVKVILFKWHFHFTQRVGYYELLKKEIIKGSIRTIQTLSHKNYLKIKRMSGIDEKFTIWQI